MADNTPTLAARMLTLLDLTDLSDQCGETAIVQLCARAVGTPGPVAAICIWPRHVTLARRILGASTVKIATVVNFPAGGTNVGRVAADAKEAIGDGANEIDLVLPYDAFLSGDEQIAIDMVSEVKAACEDKLLKVILETGAFPSQDAIARASELAIRHGADFIKTSTGKTPVSATPEAARTMLQAIKASGLPVGFKPSGGIRTLADAKLYLDLAEGIMGQGWATPRSFRYGASSLHQVLVDAITGVAGAQGSDGAY